MSLTAFKRKSIIQYGSKRSGLPPIREWIPRNSLSSVQEGPGFSLEGSHRNVGYIGKTCLMSKTGTPFRGKYPCWTSGGAASGPGNYHISLPILNAGPAHIDILGNQYKYVKPSVLSQYGMLRTKYKWAYYGVYPNNWTQSVYSGNLTDNASQQVYIDSLSSANNCVNDVNRPEKYEGFVGCGGPTLCYTTTARFRSYDQVARNGPYTKRLAQPLTSSEQTQIVKRPCVNPTSAQQHFPGPVNNSHVSGIGVSSGVGGSGISRIVQGLATPIFLTPPEPSYNGGTTNIS